MHCAVNADIRSAKVGTSVSARKESSLIVQRCVLMLNSSTVQWEQSTPDHALLPSGVGNVCSVRRPVVLTALIAAFLTVALIPLFTCSPLPLADYPNHLARMYI